MKNVLKNDGGKEKTAVEKLVSRFGDSLPFDKRLYEHDIIGSIAHAEMLGETGIIGKDESAAIVKGLKGILKDIESGAFAIGNAEDIHMFIEAVLTERIGEAGKKLHTARSRNDQSVTGLRLYLKDAALDMKARLKALINALLSIAGKNERTLMPGYTHMQRAQPVTLGHHVCAYCEMFLRDIGRFENCFTSADVNVLGSGALAGTAFSIDGEMTAEKMRFASVSQNSMDGVSDRDFVIEFSFACALTMTHLSRFCEELILWSGAEFNFVRLADEYTTGSSMMPQKRNPDTAELIRGKTGRVYGDLMSLLTMMKGLPLTYNKDMQEDKEAVFDAADTLSACLEVFTGMVSSAKFNSDAMEAAAESGFTAATDAADYLVKKGAAFRDAYHTVKQLVEYCAANNKSLNDLTLSEYHRFSPLFGKDILEVCKPQSMVENRKIIGGAGAVKENIISIKKRLSLT